MNADDREVSEGATTRGGLVNGAASIVGTALAFAMTFVITNTWGVEATGVFFAAVGAFMIVATAMKLGVETALVLFIARLRAEGRIDEGRSIVRRGLGPVALGSILAALALWLTAPQVAGLFTDDDLRGDFAATMRTLAPFVPAWTLSLSLLGATRGAGTMRPTALGVQLAQPAGQFALVAIAALADASLRMLALAWALPIALTLVGAAWSVAQLLPGGGRATSISRSELWSYATTRGIAGSLQMALDRVGVLVVGAVAGAAIAGQWAAISRLVGVAQRIFHAIGQALNPRVSALTDRGDWNGVSTAVDRITQWTMLVLAPPLLAMVMFPDTVLGLFGDDFTGAGPALRVASLIVLGASFLAHADNVLLMSGDSFRAMLNTGAALVASVLLYLVLVPPFDTIGAALAFGGGVAVYRLTSTVQIARRFGVHPVGRRTLVATIASVVGFALPLLVVRVLGSDSLTTGLVAGIAATAAYGALIAALRARRDLDLSFV